MPGPLNVRPQHGRSSRLGFAALVATLAAATAASASAAPADRAAQLERKLGAGAQVDVHAETGEVRFVGSAPGRPLARPGGLAAGAAPRSVARAFLRDNQSFFGVRDATRELGVERVLDGPRGGSSVRLAQEHAGVPVLGGELIVNVDRNGRVLSSGGEVVPSGQLGSLDVDPSISAAAAQRTARAVVARAQGVDAADLDVAPAELQIYDSRLLGGPGLERPLLVWRTEVTGGAAGEVRELVLVDAQLGVVALHFDEIAEAKQRSVCDAVNASGARMPCTDPVRSEGEGAHAVADVNDAYDFAGDTYDFFFDGFGRDSLDGRGLPLRSTVRYCDPDAACPYANAFWNGQQMAYGDGFAAADDVVGHELTHGVTEYTSGLFYYYQSGAINESLSDVFGELIDLSNGVGTDTPDVRWLLGEDVPGFGALRDMANPPRFGDPDRMTSPLYDVDADEGDAGGVHHNSGVNNKAASLMADGGSFNGQTVVGLGEQKVALIYYTAATTMLTSASDYADLAAALQQACANLVGSGGIVADDCNEVAAVVQAVEMDQQPTNAPALDAPVCSAGQTAVDAYLDDFENAASGRWALSGAWYRSQSQPSFTYARSGVGNLWGYDQPGTGDYAAAMTSDVAVPAGAFLRFEHAFGFEDGTTSRYDGGVLEYSTDGGGSWSDAGGLVLENGYTDSISSGFGNPLQGRSAFVRESNGYGSTRLDLSSLAGQTVRFRFRIGTDSYVSSDDYGWFIDDVRIYSCAGSADVDLPETSIDAGPSGIVGHADVSFAFSADELGATFQCRLDGSGFAPCASPRSYTGLADGAHTFAVRARDLAGNVDPTPASRSFTVDTVPPPSSLPPSSPSPSNPLPSDPLVPLPDDGAATPPAADDAGDPVVRPRAAIASRRTLARRGRVRLLLRCGARGAGTCRGTVLLGRRGRVGKRAFRIAAGGRGRVVVKLSRRARRALARRGVIRLGVAVRTHAPGGASTTTRARVRVILRA